MPSFREFNTKLQSLKGMRRVTRTMKMVAAGKLRRAQEALVRAEQCRTTLHRLLAILPEALHTSGQPLMAQAKHPRSALILVLTSDRGLCGGFNNNVARMVEDWVADNHAIWPRLQASFVGRKGYGLLKKEVDVRRFHQDIGPQPEFTDALRVGLELTAAFRADQYQEVYIAYTRFLGALNYEATIDRLLPVELPPAPLHEGPAVSYMIEPGEQVLADRLLAQCVHFKIFHAMLQSSAAEFGARMMAMESATSNIDKLRNRYTLLRNTARQGAITRELIEIVAGAESLKGQ